MRKVFYRCIEAFDSGQVMFKLGEECFALDVPLGYRNKFERIERDCFETNGHTWFRHTPGDVMPCDGDTAVIVLRRDGVELTERPANYVRWELPHGACSSEQDAIGWRFADSAKPEVQQKEPESQSNFPQPLSDGKLWPLGGLTFPSPQENDEMMCADMPLAAMDDGHLTPGQKAYINAKEEKVAERLRSEAAKEELKRADHGKSIQDLANANGSVKFAHDHRLGWVQ